MRALYIAVFGILAVLAAALLAWRHPAPRTLSETSVPPHISAEGNLKESRSLQTAAAEPKPFTASLKTADTPAVSMQERPQQPVQPIDERGDAMLFEAEALSGTPFDQAVTMPFD